MKVLVTGGSGFIGHYLIQQLKALGHKVRNLDIRQPINPYHAGFDCWVFTDITSYPYLYQQWRLFRPDIVFHLAAQTSVPESIRFPEHDARTNIIGTLNVIELCKELGTKKLIFASTAATYGEPKYLPIDEDHILDPGSPYGISKLAGESYIRTVLGESTVDFTILRFANVYGWGGEGVIPIFLQSALKGEPIYIYGSGRQTRDFIYVKDLVSALIKCIEQGNGHTLNLSTETMTSLLELVDIMRGVLQKDIEVHRRPVRKGDVEDSFMSNRKAKEVLGWSPQYTLRDGLLDMLRPEEMEGNAWLVQEVSFGEQ